jgi:Na+/melibiose symporter-like transporter
VLAVNIPVAALAVAVIVRTVAESRGTADGDPAEDRRFDWWGMTLFSGSLVALLVALDQVATWGWGNLRVRLLLAAAVVLIGAFGVAQRRASEHALIPADVIANRPFRVVALAVLLMSMTFFTALVYLPQFTERRLGFSPLQAGAGLLPLMLVFGTTAFCAGPLYERWGGRRVIVIGAIGLPAGMGLLSLVHAGGGYAALVPGMILLGLGSGLFYSSATTAGMASLPASRTGLASGILYMLQVSGGSVGLGVATTIVTSTAFVSGLRDALRVSAAVAAVGLVVVLTAVHPARPDADGDLGSEGEPAPGAAALLESGEPERSP